MIKKSSPVGQKIIKYKIKGYVRIVADANEIDHWYLSLYTVVVTTLLVQTN
jgi:hypothetical protein